MKPAVITKTSYLEQSAAEIWQQLLQTDTLKKVASGFATYHGDMPPLWAKGKTFDIRPQIHKRPWSWLPEGEHIVQVMRVDPLFYEIETQEYGGLVKSWNHVMRITTTHNPVLCEYTDTVTIDAGIATPIVATFAHQLYDHRHAQWCKMINIRD